MSVRKRGEHWVVDISEKGRHRVQRVLRGARTKAQALKAEAKLRTQIFEKKFGLVERPECRFDKFVDKSFLPTKKLKKSYASIDSICKPLKSFFGKHFISEIDTEMIERYRQMRVEEKTRLDRKRSPLESASPSLTKRYEPVFTGLAVVKVSLRLVTYQHVPPPS